MSRLNRLLVRICIGGLLLSLASFHLAAAQEEIPLRPTELDTSLSNLGYDDTTLEQDGSMARYTFFMPTHFVLEPESTIEVIYTYFLIGGTRPAELQVLLNNKLVDKIALPHDSVPTIPAQQRQQLSLPVDYVLAGRNYLDISLETHRRCEYYEPQAEAIIFATSHLRLVYNVPPLVPDLNDYPYPFYERSLTPSSIYLVLPQEPSAADMSAAATVSAGLGRLSGGVNRLIITTTLDSAPIDLIRDHNLIVIGQWDRNRLIKQLNLPLGPESVELDMDDGILQLIRSPWNPTRGILILTGASDNALYRASVALSHPTFLPGLHNQFSVIKQVLARPATSTSRAAMDRTFESLGYADEIMYGILPTRVTIEFYLPLSWTVLESPRLYLALNHSAIINPATSSIDIYLNDTPVGGALLDDSNQVDGLLEFELPAWLLRADRNRLEIYAHMHLPDEKCIRSDDPRAWTVIFPNSYLHLPLATKETALNLAAFPSPFSGQGDFTQTIFVLPQTLSSAYRDAFLNLVAYLGASGGNEYITIQVNQADHLSAEEKAQNHLVLIGRPTQNAIFQDPSVMAALPQPFEPASDFLIPRYDSVVVRQEQEWSLGLLQIAPSPWNPEREMLAVTGTADESVVWGLQALATRSRNLRGNLVVLYDEITLRPVETQQYSETDNYSNQVGLERVGTDWTWWLMLAEKWW